MIRLVFDLDETLVSTREANRAAYAEVGVICPPVSDYCPVSQWPTPPTPEQYVRKHEIFERHLRERGSTLPAIRFLSVIPSSVVILTGTSAHSVRTIRKVFPEIANYPVHSGMSGQDKIEWLCRQIQAGVYFDDWHVMIERVRKETRWQAVDVTTF